MIEILKKYPKTFKQFEEYLDDFNYENFSFNSEEIVFEIDNGTEAIDIPPQFLVGCYLDFLAKNDINLSVYGQIKQTMLIWKRGVNIKVFTNLEEAMEKAFSILEEN